MEPEVHYCVHKILLLVPIQSQMNSYLRLQKGYNIGLCFTMKLNIIYQQQHMICIFTCYFLKY
jgi:hypothetical protein